MYLAHFGLTERPFSPTPDPRFIYLGEAHREALAHLLFGVREPGGFVVLTGEVGMGKTMMCRYLLEHLPAEVDVALILNPLQTIPEMLASICDELKIGYPAGTTSVKVLVDALYQHLLEAHARGRKIVLVVDEAQNLSLKVLEQLRLLTNLETAREKLLHIILIGQPELGDRLNRPEIRQLAQRVTARYHLRPFSATDTAAYIRHRMGVAGQAERVFDPRALAEVHRRTGGVPRLINVLCDRALLAAYAAGVRRVDRSIVRRAATEALRARPRSRRRRRLALALAGGAAVAAAIAAAAVWAGFWPASVALPERLARAATALIGPRPAVTVAVAEAPAPAPPPAVPAPSLEQLLADPAVESDRWSAFAAVLARWQVDHVSRGEPCEAVRLSGLICLPRRGSWNILRRLDLPAVLELVTPWAERRYAALVGLTSDSATLAFGARELTVPLAEVERFWDGAFTLVWSPPPFGPATLAPGMRGRRVVWLSERLAEIEGQGEPDSRTAWYDEALRARVLQFQRHQALAADGVAGVETLVRLTTTLDPDAPTLSGGRPRS